MRKAVPVQPDGSITLPKELAEEVFGKAREVVVHVRSGCLVLSPIYVDMDSGQTPDLLVNYHRWQSLDVMGSEHFERGTADPVQFEGDLSVLSLSDVVLFLSASKKSGMLTLQGERRYALFFGNGSLVNAAAEDPRTGLAAHLLRRHFLTQQDLLQGMDLLEQGHSALTVLQETSGLGRKEFHEQWVKAVEDLIYHIFTLDAGRFSFQNGATAEAMTLDLPMTTTNYVMEATRRVDEWTRLKDRLPGPDVQLQVSEEVTASTKLSFEEEQVLSQVNGQRNMLEVLAKARVGEMEGKKAVVSLIAAGLVRVPKPQAAPGAAPPEGTELTDAEKAQVEDLIERYNSVFSTIYQALSMEVGNRVEIVLGAFFKGLEPGSSLLYGMDFEPSGVLSVPTLVQRTASLPASEREASLVRDLNELLYFQLFAVKNTLGPEMEAGIVDMARSLLKG